MADLNSTKPQMIFIAGSNGSGKSTLWKVAEFGKSLLFLNVDDKFKELKSANPEALFKEASDWRNSEMSRLIKSGESFGAETVFDEGKLGYISRAKKKGFETSIHFIALESADMAVERVRQRVQKGGHDVPEESVRRKWQESLDVANLAVERADAMFFYDNTGDIPVCVAKFRAGKVLELGERLPGWLMKMPYVEKAINDFQPPPPPNSGEAEEPNASNKSTKPDVSVGDVAMRKMFAVGHCSRLTVAFDPTQHPIGFKGQVGPLSLLPTGCENWLARLTQEVRQAFAAKLKGLGANFSSKLASKRAASIGRPLNQDHPSLASTFRPRIGIS